MRGSLDVELFEDRRCSAEADDAAAGVRWASAPRDVAMEILNSKCESHSKRSTVCWGKAV